MRRLEQSVFLLDEIAAEGLCSSRRELGLFVRCFRRVLFVLSCSPVLSVIFSVIVSYVPLCFVWVCAFPLMVVLLDSWTVTEHACIRVTRGDFHHSCLSPKALCPVRQSRLHTLLLASLRGIVVSLG